MTAKKYIKQIVERACLPSDKRKMIKSDLEAEIFAAIERGESMDEIIERMGAPDDIAAELFENSIDQPVRPFKEYRSKQMLFGLPLVHIIRGNYMSAIPRTRAFSLRGINIGGRHSHLPYQYSLPTARGIFAYGPKAKGVISIGNFSAGVLAIGNISAGIISIGNICAGLITIGNIALACLAALGNVAISALAAGNMAIGYGAAGNCALGEFALGNEAVGTFAFSISDLSAQLEQTKLFIEGLNAPAPVKAFFSVVEKALQILDDPVQAVPTILILSAAIAAIIISLIIIPRRLLKSPDYSSAD